MKPFEAPQRSMKIIQHSKMHPGEGFNVEKIYAKGINLIHL